MRDILTIQTLVATVDRQDRLLAQKMNIQTDALIGNQCGCEGEETVLFNGNSISFIDTADRGVGKNRNLLIEKATADICVFADDDMRFLDGYDQTARNVFNMIPTADVIVFNLLEKNPRRYINKKVFKVSRSNYARYGAARMAFRRESVVPKGIRFSLLFGGGAVYGSGEDTIFLKECMDKGLEIWAVPYALSEIDQSAPSTWFSGYNEKFFFDKGALYSVLHPKTAGLFCLRFAIKYRRKFKKDFSTLAALKQMMRGIGSYRQRGCGLNEK
jgi:glycosyltransferase involved in cell wall biosynthesis